MNCAESEVLLHALIDGELDAGHAREVEAHAATCAACAEKLASFRAMRKAISGAALKETAPPHLRNRIEQSLTPPVPAAVPAQSVFRPTRRSFFGGFALGAGLSAAVAAGVDGIEHCTFLNENGLVASPDVIDAIVAQGVWCGVTIPRVVPGMPEDIVALVQGIWRNIRQLMDSGAHVALSTDAGVDPAKPHDVLPLELADLSRHGFTGTEVLTGATAAAAASCGLGHRKGHIAPGYDADLLAVAAGVDEDLAELCDVKAVWRSGTQVPLQPSAHGQCRPLRQRPSPDLPPTSSHPLTCSPD